MLRLYLILILSCINVYGLLAQKATLDHLYAPKATYWHLKKPSIQKDSLLCGPCWTPLDSTKVSRLVLREDGFWYYSNDVKRVSSLFREHFKDGLALELVAQDPVECESELYGSMPSRRNEQSLSNGIILKPVYRWKMFKTWRKKKREYKKSLRAEISDLKDTMAVKPRAIQRQIKDQIAKLKKEKWAPKDIEVFLGPNPIPDNFKDEYAYNAVLIRKKRLCRIGHFAPLGGENYPYYETMPLVFNWPKNCKLVFPPDTVSVEFIIPFEKGDISLNYEALKDSLENIEQREFQVKSATIRSYASVEGTKAINMELKYARAIELMKTIEDAYSSEEIPKTIYTGINWRLFRKQLSTHANPKMKSLKSRSKESLQKLVDDPTYQALFEPLLYEQRKARITILIERELTDFHRREMALKAFHNSLKASLKDTARGVYFSYLDEAACWQKYIYDQVTESSSRYHLVKRMRIPYHPAFGQIQNNYLQMLELYNPMVASANQVSRSMDQSSDMPDDTKRYEILSRMASVKDADPIVTYNRLVFLLERWTDKKLYDWSVTPDSMFRLIDILTPIAKRTPGMDIERMKLNYHFKSANYYMGSILNKPNLLYSLRYLHRYYQDKEISVPHAIGLARLFIGGGRYKYAANILKPFAEENSPDHELYSLYVKLYYEHLDEYPETNYYTFLLQALSVLGQRSWCQLFDSPEPINFQAFDNEMLREVYCEVCE